MRALLLLSSIAAPAIAWWLGSFTGLVIMEATCLALVAASFFFSMEMQEARESRQMQRAFGRGPAFPATGLGNL
ncbi:hypothetical protein [Variovorax sp. JS1663]|uniref:hypothetical protein n=1 Tax=Variovorax sp. JS1663 TaxID=1851577 RepID=UPI000B3415E5|nr:hypothetical protein [Variovorax sp. JS1663]